MQVVILGHASNLKPNQTILPPQPPNLKTIIAWEVFPHNQSIVNNKWMWIMSSNHINKEYHMLDNKG